MSGPEDKQMKTSCSPTQGIGHRIHDANLNVINLYWLLMKLKLIPFVL